MFFDDEQDDGLTPAGDDATDDDATDMPEGDDVAADVDTGSDESAE